MRDDFWERLSRPCPVAEGTRIELVFMANDPDPITPGTRGTVRGGNGAQLWVEWDNGRSLNLALPEDVWRVVSDDA